MYVQGTEDGQKCAMRGSEELDKFSGVGVRYCDSGEEVESAARCPLPVDEGASHERFRVVVVVVDDGVDQLCWENRPGRWVGMIHCVGSLDSDIRISGNIYSHPRQARQAYIDQPKSWYCFFKVEQSTGVGTKMQQGDPHGGESLFWMAAEIAEIATDRNYKQMNFH